MALFNYATKEITIKIVYYGPGLSGKTTNLQHLHSRLNPETRGKLLSLATEADRTLFFDFLPIEIGKISDFSIRFQLYTVPGQVRYNATRKLVLKGADAIVFVADSQREMREQNIESMNNMSENLVANNINPDDIPVLLQFNKRDLTNILSIEELNRDLNKQKKYDYRESVAINGTGVEETFQQITKIAIKSISKRHKVKVESTDEVVEAVHEEPSPEPARTSSYAEEPFPTPLIERFDTTELTHSEYETREKKQETRRASFEEEAAVPREVVVRQIKEVPVIPQEKIDGMLNGITEISQTLKELKNIVSSIHSEIKEMKKDQKDIHRALREVQSNFENLRQKRSWFRFS